jgi:hypothetical protein
MFNFKVVDFLIISWQVQATFQWDNNDDYENEKNYNLWEIYM